MSPKTKIRALLLSFFNIQSLFLAVIVPFTIKLCVNAPLGPQIRPSRPTYGPLSAPRAHMRPCAPICALRRATRAYARMWAHMCAYVRQCALRAHLRA